MKLKDILEGCLFTDGDWIESKDQDPLGEIRLIQLADIGDGFFVDKSSRFINKETAKRLRCTFLKKNDLLIARMPDPLGRACVFPLEENEKYVTAVDVCIIRPQENCDNRYLQYCVNSTDIRNSIERQKTGTTRERITRKKLGELEIPFPSLPQQQKIAAILDAADALRQNDKALIAKYDELTQALFLDMFGDPVSNPKGWVENSLKNLCNKITDGTHDTPSRLTEGIKFITGKHIRPFVIDYENSDYVTEEVHNEIYRRCNPQYGDILYTNIGVNFATAAMNIVDYEFSMKNVALLKHKREFVNGRFLESILNNEFFKDRLKRAFGIGGAQQFLSLSNIKSIMVLCPPLELQNQFAERVAVIEDQKAIAQAALEKSEELFNSLLQKAFKGELV